MKGNYENFLLWRLIIEFFYFRKLLGGSKECLLFHGSWVMDRNPLC